MCPVVLSAQPNPGHPLVNEASILPSADMVGMINSARKDKVFERASSALEPSEDAAAGRFDELKLNRPTKILVEAILKNRKRSR